MCGYRSNGVSRTTGEQRARGGGNAGRGVQGQQGCPWPLCGQWGTWASGESIRKCLSKICPSLQA